MLIILTSLLGLLFGSFISNSLWQIRINEIGGAKANSKPNKRSVCGHCGHVLAPKDLIPIFSWLFLRGRCRYCQQKLSAQYPLMEFFTAVFFVWSALVWELANPSNYWSLGLWLLVLSGLLVMAIYDLRWMELPNKVMSITLLLAVAWQVVVALHLDPASHLSAHLLAAVAGGGAFYLLHALGNGKWMGGGDVKLAFLMGIILGGQKLLLALFVAFVLAAIFSLFMMGVGKLTRKDLIPFGPFLIFGTIFATLHGTAIINAYINFYSL